MESCRGIIAITTPFVVCLNAQVFLIEEQKVRKWESKSDLNHISKTRNIMLSRNVSMVARRGLPALQNIPAQSLAKRKYTLDSLGGGSGRMGGSEGKFDPN